MKGIKEFLAVEWLDLKSSTYKMKRRIWNKHILLWWYRLWVRRNEFHRSLDMDFAAMMEMDESEWKKYLTDLVRRRKIAHQRGLGQG
jgi:hypothetical protein